MDFTLPSEATEAAGLAATVFADHCASERLRAVDEAGDERFDPGLWRALGSAGLLGLTVPEEYGGAGLGLVELAAVLIEAGRAVAPVPLTTHAVAAMAIAEHGSDELRQAWLGRAAEGSAILTAATRRGRDGAFDVVPAGALADAFLLPAAADGALLLLTTDSPGVTMEHQRLSDGDVAARISVDPAVVAGPVVGGPEAISWLRDLLDAAAVAHQLGVVEGALALTAGYARTREQFGRPIGTFQAVSQRLADGYIDVLGARLTMWQAVWRLAAGLPAGTELEIAKLWAADAGHRLAHTTVHVHGGVGIDLDGEAHRYFTAAKRGEFLLGGTTAAARAIGAALASA